DTFHIVNRNPSDDRQALTERLTSTLGEILSGRKTVEEVLAKSERRFGLRDTQAHIATEVRLDNHASGKETVVEVWTADRPFLLYRITKALFEFGVSIRQAKVNTIAGRAIDAFYIVDAQGHQITGQHAQALRAKLHAELG
ncbi:hypothetical protein KDL45_18380, partial [bacterium]|nr:hypothetical protein [bacterium]